MLFTRNANEFETAWWCPTKGDRIKRVAIGIEMGDSRDKHYRAIMQGLKIDDAQTVLKTTYNNEYEVRQELYYRDKWWVIQDVKKDTRTLNPQALAFVKPEEQTIYYLTVIGVS